MTDKAILHEKDLISCLVKILDPYIKDINGTGFFIHPNGYILTCYHVIKLYIDNEIKEVLLLYKDQKLKAKICYEYCFKEADISILKVIEQSKIKIYYPILDIHNKWEIDDRIISYGFPTDNFEFEKSGIGITGAIGGYTKISGVDVIQINDISLHYLSPGYSGSPVIHLKSKKVIGLIYAKIEGEKDEEIEKIKKFQAFFVPLWPIFKYFSELRDFHAHKFIITDQVINLSEYRQYILTQLKDFQKSQYTVLDVDPMVLNVDRNLTPISNFSIPIIEAFKNYDRFIIIGEAGAGKTASMYFIAQLVADDNTKYKELLDIPSEYCIYIKLSRFKFRKDTDKISYKKIISLIGETLYIGRASKIPLSLETVENFLSKYDILFLFDGLNEVQYEIRNLCLEAIDDLARKHPKNRYVITTRLYGFLPQEEWNYVKIKKLSNQQVMEFLMRYTNKEMAQNLFQNVFDSRNQLLRIPLFLSLIIDMFNKYPNKFPSLFGSRSNIIAKYSERLLLRDDREKHSSVKINFYMDQLRNVQLHNMLYILAEIIQELGQHLKKEEVLEYILTKRELFKEDRTNLENSIDELCHRGVLINDGDYIQFCHHTIQEYFYAGRIVNLWRKNNRIINNIPKWVKDLFHSPVNTDAFVYIIAYLSDLEINNIITGITKINPEIAMSWVDDLSIEKGSNEAIKRFFKTFNKISFFALLCSKLFIEYVDAINIFFSVLLFSFILLILNPFQFSMFSIVILILSVYTLIFTYFVLSYYFYSKLIKIISKILSIHDASLRRRIINIVANIDHFLIDINLKRLMQDYIAMEKEQNILFLLKDSNFLYLKILAIGYINSNFALPILERLIKYNNIFSIAAIKALITRSKKFTEEKERIKLITKNIWNDKKFDPKIKFFARQFLILTGEIPDKYFSFMKNRILKGVHAILLGLLPYIGTIFIYFFSHKIIKSSISIRSILHFSLVYNYIIIFIISIIIFIDAQLIKAKRILGCIDFSVCNPWHYSLGCFFLFPIIFPIYIIYRERIRKNSTEINWESLEKSIFN